MSSGMKWKEKYYSVINITSESYFSDDLRSVILGQEIIDKPGQKFRYSSGDTQLLAMVIEKATKTTLTNYLSEKFWKPMGAENSALWQMTVRNQEWKKHIVVLQVQLEILQDLVNYYINKGME